MHVLFVFHLAPSAVFVLSILCTSTYRSTGRICEKLIADGTNIGKRNHCVLVAFGLLDCPKTVASVDGVHSIALLDEVVRETAVGSL